MQMSAENYLNSDKLGIKINTSTLQPAVQHLMDASPSIVLTLDVSASMEYQVCITMVNSVIHLVSGLLLIYQR
jgi:hypothetical protein